MSQAHPALSNRLANPLVLRSPLRRVYVLPALMSAAFALAPMMWATAPDGDIGNHNTAGGAQALGSISTGGYNTGIGYQALFSLTTDNYNTAVGASALFKNIGGVNTALGTFALFSNTSGAYNTAVGASALYYNTTGIYNTANGSSALQNNSTGSSNTASGLFALQSNTTGNNNTATGYIALQNNTTGINNTADGWQALGKNVAGSNNTATGYQALVNSVASNNTAYGRSALLRNSTGTGNIAMGINAGSNLTTGANNIDIGNLGVAAEAATIRIGTVGTQTNTYIAGISGVTVAGGVGVVVDASGHLGVATSSARFKDGIKAMDKASEAILALEPVTFRYKQDLDPEGVQQFGLIAEQVEKVNPDLVARDGNGKVYTVRYEAVNAMLLNEFLKEHRKVEEQEANIARLKLTDEKQEATITQQEKMIVQLKQADARQEATIVQQQKEMKVLVTMLKEQAVQLKKVSAQLEANRPAPQVAANNQ